MSKDQRVDDGRLEAEHVKLDYRDSTDDETRKLVYFHTGGAWMSLTHRVRISVMGQIHRSDTQRDEWLLKTEPFQGARPKWNIGERPPVVDERTGVLDLGDTGGARGVGK